MTASHRTSSSKFPLTQAALACGFAPAAAKACGKRGATVLNRMHCQSQFRKSMGHMQTVWTGEQIVPFRGKRLTFSTPEEMDEVLSSL